MPFAQINGMQMHYQIYGEGEPLLLVHGLGSSGRDWEIQYAHFAQNYQVIVFDGRGHGQSDKPPGPYSIARFAEDCAKLLKFLELEQVHVVGISMGGMIALQLAVDYPEMMKSLVVVNTGPELVVHSLNDLFQLWQRLLIIRLVGMRKLGEILSRRLFPKPEQEVLRKIFIERSAENDPRSYINSLKGMVGWSVVDCLHKITCPTLIVAADNDYTPVEEKRPFVERIPNVQLAVIEDAHHAVTVERPEEFNRIVEDFLRKI